MSLTESLSLAMGSGEKETVKDVCGLHFRSWSLGQRGKYVPIHVHDYDHATVLANGSIAVFIEEHGEGKMVGEYHAPDVIELKAGVQHTFLALEDATRIFCVHDLKGEPYRTMRLKGEIE